MPEKLTLLPRGGLAREYEDGVGPDRILVRDERGVEHWVDPYGERGQQSVPGRPHLTVVSILERPDERGIPRYRLGVDDHREPSGALRYIGGEESISGAASSSSSSLGGVGGLGRVLRQIQERLPEGEKAGAMNAVVAMSGIGLSPGSLELHASRDLPGGRALVFSHADGHVAYYPESDQTEKFLPGEYEEMTGG